MENEMKLYIVSWFFILGLLIGGYLNVFFYRVPRRLNLFLFSTCPHCGADIHLRHILPLLGYVLLGGKCRCCQSKIDIRYAFIEFCVGLIFLLLSIVIVPAPGDRLALESAVGRTLWAGYFTVFVWILAYFAIFRKRLPLGFYIVGGVILATIFLPPYFRIDFLQFFFELQHSPEQEFLGILFFSTFYVAITILILSFVSSPVKDRCLTQH